MFKTLAKNTLDHINIVHKLIDVHNTVLSQESASTREKIKIYSSSACITRLYALFEGFISSALSDYLDFLASEVLFKDLSDEFKNHYRIGVSNILSKNHHGAYKALIHKDLVRYYYEAISDHSPYKFISQALTKHDSNFRMSIVEGLFNKLQLKDLKNWISNSEQMKILYPEESSIIDKVDSELNNFIQLRNDASHTTTLEIESSNILIEYCELFSALINSISDYLASEVLQLLIKSGKAKHVGQVTETFKRSNAYILKAENNVTIKTGDEFYFVNQNNCYKELINSIEFNNIKTSKVISKVSNLEIGIVSNRLPMKKMNIYKLK